MRVRSCLRLLLLVSSALSFAGMAAAQGLVVPGPAPSGPTAPQPAPPAAPPAPSPTAAPSTSTTAPTAPPPAPTGVWVPPPGSSPPAPGPGQPPPPAGYPPPPGQPQPPPGYVLAPVGTPRVYEPPLPVAPPTPTNDETRGETQRRRFGPVINMFGPNALVGVGVTGQVHRMLEVMVDVGYLQSGATEQSAAATAEAEIRLITPMVRGRLWPMNRHNFIVDLGAGASFIKLTADGRNRDGSETLHYERTGTPGIVAGGIGYGYRAPGPFRFAAVIGRQLMFGKLKDSTLTATDNFSQTDRTDLKNELDKESNDLAELNTTYVQVSLGLLF